MYIIFYKTWHVSPYEFNRYCELDFDHIKAESINDFKTATSFTFTVSGIDINYKINEI